ncbi:hypothetical protein ES677_09755 [Bizionia gelidisalsuginis]|uniref:Lipoprotein n=2 Tax=Bizionia TaxID=283785 RepID=A0A8H2QFX2_9FLAO|nr:MULTISPECIES: hypothetical protein [Bizionia]TYB76809.1 hypothetical protein ES676_05565 [Bizionia saleffrena]TYC12041.1 hypothetical protein ES677_09755 [Bizionia gelidisalsuginis]
MRLKNKFKLPLFCLAIALFSCENEADRKERLAIEEEHRIELKEKRVAKEAERTFQLEQERIEREKREEEERIIREARLEKERLEKAIYAKFNGNSLNTGAMPYSRYYGANSTCVDYGCSEIKVRTSNSDVIVTIKKNGNVVRHAYINSGSSYTFSFPNGIYQTFFYYGKGWNPEKEMKGGTMKGGFIDNEVFGKDEPQTLSNNVLEYQLILQENGNFSTRPSNSEEAL